MKKVNLQDVADRAGVGVATVDRVLNERGNVSSHTAARVIQAARELGLKRILPDQWQGLVHIELFLSGNGSQFQKRLSDAFMQWADKLGQNRLVMHRTFIREDQPVKLARQIIKAASRRKGIIVYGPQHEAVCDAVNEVYDLGIPVFTVATDLPETDRIAHVGIDQYQAGRTIGHLMGLICKQPGKIAVVTGRMDYLAHRQRVNGFRDALSEFPHLVVLPDIESMEYNHLIEKMVGSVLRENPDISGIYNTSQGNYLISRLLERYQENYPAFFTHEVYPTTCTLLKHGRLAMVLDQNPEQHAFRALDMMIRTLSGETVPDTEGRVRFTLHTPENLL